MTSAQKSTALLFAAFLFFSSCNNSGQENANQTTGDTTSSTTSTTSSPATTSASTTVTTPQDMLIMMHKVTSYAKWKPIYDGHDTARQAAGVHNYVIGRGVQDSNMILVALKVDDTARAMAFTKNPGLKQAMQKGGVIGTPSINLLTVVFQDTGTINTPLRSSVMFTVKDWDKWQKAFEEGRQQRMDNGIAVRAYGHDAKDNHKVRVVTALLDSAKAVAYFKSDSLKKRMAASGVVGQPNRFLYRIVQRY